MSENFITINGENIATILFVGVIGYAIARVAVTYFGKKASA